MSFQWFVRPTRLLRTQIWGRHVPSQYRNRHSLPTILLTIFASNIYDYQLQVLFFTICARIISFSQHLRRKCRLRVIRYKIEAIRAFTKAHEWRLLTRYICIFNCYVIFVIVRPMKDMTSSRWCLLQVSFARLLSSRTCGRPHSHLTCPQQPSLTCYLLSQASFTC